MEGQIVEDGEKELTVEGVRRNLFISEGEGPRQRATVSESKQQIWPNFTRWRFLLINTVQDVPSPTVRRLSTMSKVPQSGKEFTILLPQ